MKKNKPETKNRSLDQTDREIIKLLQKNGRLSNTVIAKRLSVSEATVRTRLNRLINEDYIQIVAVSNPLKLGFEIVGVIRIDADIKKIRRITKELEKLDAIWFIVHTTGGNDIYTEFIVKTLDELNDLLFDKINKIDGIIRTNTSIILRYIKRNYAWGTG